MKRTTEFVLGLLGGIFGFGGSFFALFVGVWSEEISNLGSMAFLFSILAIVGSIVVKFKAKIGGWMLLVSGIGILISISLFGVLPALLLVPAGLMGLLRKDKNNNIEVQA
ncbi:hypothetical protein CVD25_15630 [Bacillus canaveralius]|uniref:DUF4064 domain-containing protein n=1 Tax=Bacillus canaveralius TaxID=1403243 RepID=A0A2N5GJG5_9BACI|nr:MULTISPECIES: hypothetical protein [Bacillaceae]PLR81330.1 hypothetical protein CU635_15275 [Bacillus canaveralius]PLR94894.1 hypothetical protein CVD25_15630 [Bacillus canaveralius]UGB31296.1 hypothetical protein LPC09_01815 [Metabacillus sp. B2-18]